MYQLVFAPIFVQKKIFPGLVFIQEVEKLVKVRCEANIESKAKEIERVCCAHTEMLTIFVFVVRLNCIPKSVAKLSGRQAPVRL